MEIGSGMMMSGMLMSLLVPVEQRQRSLAGQRNTETKELNGWLRVGEGAGALGRLREA